MRRLAIILLPWLTTAALAGEPVDERIDAAPSGQVHIDVVRGRVQVLSWDQNQVAVEGTRDGNSEAFEVRRDGDTIFIEDRLANIRLGGGGEGTRITVRVPRDSRLRVSVVSADLVVSNIAGAVRLQSVSGDIEAAGLGSDVDITTVSGDVEIEVNAVRLNVQTTSGTVLADNAGALQRGRLNSVSGDVTLGTRFGAEADLELETVSGDISLALPDDADARVDVVAGPGADIRNRFNDQQPVRPRYGPGARLEMTLGSGSGYVRLSSVSGTLALERG
ncbi:MAG: DUF4097 family beta strand repeat-containing protein [Pseudomonadales bacterium]